MVNGALMSISAQSTTLSVHAQVVHITSVPTVVASVALIISISLAGITDFIVLTTT